jgi:hypothetical protein
VIAPALAGWLPCATLAFGCGFKALPFNEVNVFSPERRKLSGFDEVTRTSLAVSHPAAAVLHLPARLRRSASLAGLLRSVTMPFRCCTKRNWGEWLVDLLAR